MLAIRLSCTGIEIAAESVEFVIRAILTVVAVPTVFPVLAIFAVSAVSVTLFVVSGFVGAGLSEKIEIAVYIV